MRTNRPLSLSTLLLTVLAVGACDPDAELEFELREEATLADDEIDELDTSATELDTSATELAAPSNEQTVSSCSLGLPNSVIHELFRLGRAEGTFDGITSGDYSFEVTPSPNNPGPIQSWSIYVNGVAVDTKVSSLWPPFAADDGDDLEFEMMAFSAAQVGWFYEFQLDLYSEPGHQLLCSDTTGMEVQPDCGNVGDWSTQPWAHPWYDGANCYVGPLPGGVNAFVWGNAWYVEPGPGNQCGIGVFDSANCYIGSAPWGQQAFIWGGNMYYEL